MSHDLHEPQRPGWTVPIVVLIIALTFIWYVVSDRITPFTNNATVQAYVVAVVPDVSGYVSEIPAKKMRWSKQARHWFRSRPAGS